MKIIDLLNKIANGEEVPERIKYDNKIWTYDIHNKDYNEMDCGFYGLFTNYFIGAIIECLNDEAEIIGENKIPEKIDLYKSDDTTIKGLVKTINVMFEDTTNKINEIIDYLESKEKGE